MRSRRSPRPSGLTVTRAACPLCGAAAASSFTVTDRNRAVSNRRFSYLKCLGCDSYFLTDPPLELTPYYEKEYYEIPSPAELDDLASQESHKLELLKKGEAKDGRLVEIGAGFGVFARAARNGGYDVTAIEMDGPCCEYLESVVDVAAIRSDIPAETLALLPPSRVIVMWHVLEHLPNPLEILDAIALNLEVGGVLALAMPNPQSVQFRLLRGRWAHVDAPRHLFLIPAPSLTAQAAARGLRCVHVTASDPDGRRWNRFGWEYALRRFPAQRPASRTITVASKLLELTLRPLEGRRLGGTAYTAIFVKEPAHR